mmetsp:Transcript_35356/g.101673  ORF Transcript_35356/g.101673 Transcript_35356/m.101673 type:complete len:204 (+) Transcript_35356:449-1060(+)
MWVMADEPSDALRTEGMTACEDLGCLVAVRLVVLPTHSALKHTNTSTTSTRTLTRSSSSSSCSFGIPLSVRRQVVPPPPRMSVCAWASLHVLCRVAVSGWPGSGVVVSVAAPAPAPATTVTVTVWLSVSVVPPVRDRSTHIHRRTVKESSTHCVIQRALVQVQAADGVVPVQPANDEAAGGLPKRRRATRKCRRRHRQHTETD